MAAHPHTIYIKNMVCPRCIKAVTETLQKLGIRPLSVTLGTAILPKEPDKDLLSRLDEELKPQGFELLENPHAQLAELIKNAIIELTHYRNDAQRINLSAYLSERFHKDYSTLSKLFSEQTGTTLEKYAIAQKIERAKELLTYGELTLNEIADQLGYSSTAYLSTQFKSMTGMTPGTFKKETARQERKPLDEV